MSVNFNNITVYHGNYTEVQIPDLKKCREGKDFGRDFYITTDKNQAVKFAKLIAQRHNISYGVLNEYILSDINNLSYYDFKSTDISIVY